MSDPDPHRRGENPQFYGAAAHFPKGNAPPTNFDPNNPHADAVAKEAQLQYLTRETFIKVETAKLYRERVQECYKLEGVNHYQNCKEHVKNYMESIKNAGAHRINIGPYDKTP
eukprot:CAMPEP_0197592000 /NCGR_PEP_ID=MMETSP1326-20131121/14357_1 /TAXON_ID=1155430 /ORGANISM="Genus nov. species nov., Strain RCC2288" /LENGTH=112 /DNA_ID=CAMNT_0043157611 /DNA_START=142 /DNA_END=480 /DNA_ORIENTATION=+